MQQVFLWLNRMILREACEGIFKHHFEHAAPPAPNVFAAVVYGGQILCVHRRCKQIYHLVKPNSYWRLTCLLTYQIQQKDKGRPTHRNYFACCLSTRGSLSASSKSYCGACFANPVYNMVRLCLALYWITLTKGFLSQAFEIWCEGRYMNIPTNKVFKNHQIYISHLQPNGITSLI